MMVAEKYGEARRIAYILSNGGTQLFFHVHGATSWRLCVSIVNPQLEEEEGPAVSFGSVVLIKRLKKRPPKGCIEREEDRSGFRNRWLCLKYRS